MALYEDLTVGKLTITGTVTGASLLNSALGTPTSGTLTNCTGLPLAGVTLTKAVVTGSKGSGAALTSLLSGLVALGLITDSTTA